MTEQEQCRQTLGRARIIPWAQELCRSTLGRARVVPWAQELCRCTLGSTRVVPWALLTLWVSGIYFILSFACFAWLPACLFSRQDLSV